MNGYKMFCDRMGSIDVKNYVADAAKYHVGEYVITVCENTNANVNKLAADGYTDKWITKLLEKSTGFTVGLLHKPGNSIDADKQVQYFINRVKLHYGSTKLRAVYVMFNTGSTMSKGGAVKYVAMLRASFPKLALVYVGPSKPPCAGAEYIISQADDIMTTPATSTWASYKIAYDNHRKLNKTARIMPFLSLITDTLYGFQAPAKVAKRNLQAAAFNTAAMSDDCMTMGIWRQDVISGAGDIMDGIKWTREDVAETTTTTTPDSDTTIDTTDLSAITDQTEQIRLMWADYVAAHK